MDLIQDQLRVQEIAFQAAVAALPTASVHKKSAEKLPALNVAAWNCKWLAHYKEKDNNAITQLLDRLNADILLIIELMQSPLHGSNDGAKSTKTMIETLKQLSFVTTDEKSGKTSNHATSSELIGVFYKPATVSWLKATYLSQPLRENPNFDRVPVAHFWQQEHSLFKPYFCTIGFHLHAKASGGENRRSSELEHMFGFVIDKNLSVSTLLLGDANIQNDAEIQALQNKFEDWKFLFSENTNTAQTKPFDNIFHHKSFHWDVLGTKLVRALPEDTVASRDASKHISDHNAILVNIQSRNTCADGWANK